MKRLLLVLAACGSDPAPATDATATHELGMNDVSILVPLPETVDAPVLLGLYDAPPIVPDVWMQAVVFTRGDLGSQAGDPYDRTSFQITAVRFDICDRAAIGPCPEGTDGRVRIVAQPIIKASDGTTKALDVGVHLFYPIPAADLPSVISQLRALPARAEGPLAVSTGDATYFTALRSLVRTYARADNLVRITANGQHALATGSTWAFRQFDRTADGTGFEQTMIPQAGSLQQDFLLQAGDISYTSFEIADAPPGFAADVDGLAFAMLADKTTAVDAIAQGENPLLHDTFDTQCITCHVGTYLGAYRATEVPVALAALPSWYQSTTHDASVPAQTDPRRIRGFGYWNREPIISQRVANETANVLDEISARFPR